MESNAEMGHAFFMLLMYVAAVNPMEAAIIHAAQATSKIASRFCSAKICRKMMIARKRTTTGSV